MASTSAIDTQEAGSGLRAANQASEKALDASPPRNPAGKYIAGVSTTLTGLMTTALGALSATEATGAAATESTVLEFDSTEEANTTSLST
jgi:hypothetical protein